MGSEEAFERFAAAYRRDGGADPREYLSQLSGPDRVELQAMIEAFLERAPRRSWDPGAFPGSLAERALARADGEAAAPEPLGWPQLLPQLRAGARLKRRTVVERLAETLGFPGSEDRVAAYYHLMEQGQLRPSGVSDRVLEALAAVLDSSVEALRRSGNAGQHAAEDGGEVFARVGAPNPQRAPSEDSPAKITTSDAGGSTDELDLLFTGGGEDVR